jgi:hypothetical protein
VYPKENGSRERALTEFYKKVSEWKWESVDDSPKCKRGRKPKEKQKSVVDMDKPRNQKYSWLK